MCLTHLKEFEPRKDGIGYQVKLKYDKDEYSSLYFPYPIKLGKKYDCGNHEWVRTSDVYAYYKPGWHVFQKFKHASKFRVSGKHYGAVIVKIKGEDVLATGTRKVDQEEFPVVVYRYLTVLEEIAGPVRTFMR